MQEPIKQNESTENRPQGERTLDAALVKMNLKEFIEIIKSEKAWQEKDRNAMTIYKNEGMRMVLIALHENAFLAEHTANGIISVQLLEGEIIFKTQTENAHLLPGEMIALHKGLTHSVQAIKESVFLLTVATAY
jgi:quercetin dioxygenase-like cupin family protein